MKHIGKSYPIHDAQLKASGRAIYAGDMKLQNMLHMAILFSTIPHGYVKSISCEKALELDGVVDVIHCFNSDHNEYNRYHSQFRQPIIASEKVFNSHVRFVGDRVAGVVAKTEEIARQAVSLIEVEYEQLPYSLNSYETLDGKIDNIHESGAIHDNISDVVGTLYEGDELIEVNTETHLSKISHLAMEPHACVADYDKYSGELRIYSPNQAVFGIRSLIADMFDMDYNKVQVVKTTMGGSFGAKQEWMLEPAAAAAAIRVNRPVRLVYRRDETIISTICRAPMHFNTTMRFTKDGELKGVECDAILDAGAYLGNSYNYAMTVASKMFRIYKLPYLNYKAKVTITNTIVGGAFRGWTSPEATIMFEYAMDMAANKLGIDPIDLRLKNVMLPYDVDLKTGVSMGNFRIKQALCEGREDFRWDERKKELAKRNSESKRYKCGLGVALGGHVNNFYPSKSDFARVEMRLTESGSVICNATLHDHGCGTVTAFKMIAAEALGISIDRVKIKEGDTDVTPYDIGCFSSRTTYVVGKATYECALKLKEHMKEHMSIICEIPKEDIEIDENTLYSKTNPEIKLSWSDLVHKSHQEYMHEICVSYEHVAESNPGVAGAHFALVEVDTYTGMVKILDYLAVHDIGKVINREICVAQTQGAVLMGAGAAIYEHIITGKNGVPKGSMKDYHIINSFEAPNIRVKFIEEGDEHGPFGAKSIGEVAHTPVTAAVVSAVNNALNSEFGSVPITPDVILDYLAKGEQQYAAKLYN